jgi:hypothetical protein
MRKICERRLPSLDCDYCSFTAFSTWSLGYYSHWIGWDKEGREVREASPLDGLRTTENHRKFMEYPVYVIETAKELAAWQFHWHAAAIIPEPLARQFLTFAFNRDHLVAATSPPKRSR